MKIETLKKTLPPELTGNFTDLELLLLLRWKPEHAPKTMNLWGLYLGTGRDYPVQIFTCTRTKAPIHTKFSPGKPNLLETQEQFHANPDLITKLRQLLCRSMSPNSPLENTSSSTPQQELLTE